MRLPPTAAAEALLDGRAGGKVCFLSRLSPSRDRCSSGRKKNLQIIECKSIPSLLLQTGEFALILLFNKCEESLCKQKQPVGGKAGADERVPKVCGGILINTLRTRDATAARFATRAPNGPICISLPLRFFALISEQQPLRYSNFPTRSHF